MLAQSDFVLALRQSRKETVVLNKIAMTFDWPSVQEAHRQP